MREREGVYSEIAVQGWIYRGFGSYLGSGMVKMVMMVEGRMESFVGAGGGLWLGDRSRFEQG